MVGPKSIGTLPRRAQQEEDTKEEAEIETLTNSFSKHKNAFSRYARLAAFIPRAIASPTRSRSAAIDPAAALRGRSAIRTMSSKGEQLPPALVPAIVGDASGHKMTAPG
eukprot:3661350-Prymnesium_polylepis.1